MSQHVMETFVLESLIELQMQGSLGDENLQTHAAKHSMEVRKKEK